MQHIYRKNEQHLIENFELAAADNFVGWVLHHRLELTLDGHNAAYCADLKRMKMYWRRPYFELIYLRVADHTAMHNRARSLDGKYCSPWNKGKKCGPLSEEHKQKIREGNRKPKSEHMRKALSESRKEYWKTHTISKEQMAKMAAGRVGKKRGSYKKTWTTWYIGPDGKRVYV